MAGAARREAGSLPAELTSFIGRRHEASEVRRLLSQTRLLTLTGPGGVGKTRLALHVAYQVRKTFPHGVWLVDLAALQEPRLLANAVVGSLRIRDESTRKPQDVLKAYLADKSLLLLLDNCEHLLDACAELVELLLRAAPDLRVLATSREPMRVAGEYIYDVPPLSVPDPEYRFCAGDLVRYEAAALLYDRATAAVPSFTVDTDGAVALVRIAQRLDGLPLAIELAATRLRALSPQQLLQRLNDLFAALGGGTRIGGRRQRTLRSMIDWSFDLCSPAERTLWARISVFSGSFDFAAAEAVCAGDRQDDQEILDLVMGLLDKSILIREEHCGAVRYRLLDTIRQYGRERLDESGECDELRRRHRDHYRRLARCLEDEWYTEHQLTWFNRLRTEHPNVRVALDYCATVPGEARVGMEIASVLRTYWHSCGALDEGRRWIARLLTVDPEPGPARAKAVLTDAWLALYSTDVAAAKRRLEEARVLVDRFGDPLGRAVLTHVAGLTALLSGEAANAAGLLETALARYQEVGAPGGVLVTLFYLGSTVLMLGDAERAWTLLEQCIDLSESLGDQWIRAWAFWSQGVVAWRRGDPGRGAELERASIRRKQQFDDRMGIGQCVDVLAWTAAAEGDGVRAARLLGAVQVIWAETGATLYQHLAGFHREVETELRRTLGPDVVDAAMADGAKLAFDEIVAEALGGPRTAPDEAREGAAALRALGVLTPREREVAGLITEGLSNRQIAARLVISQRTAEGHVEHIMAKLGFQSRAQVAAWYTQLKSADGPDRA